MRKATQCLVPYSENKGYASNPRCFPLQLVAIATKHSEKQHEQSALSWGKQPGIITIVSMDEIKGILFLTKLVVRLYELRKARAPTQRRINTI